MLFGRRGGGERRFTRVFFATDLHGSWRTFRKFLNAASFYEAHVLVMGGDVTGKVLVPIIDLGGERYRMQIVGERREAAGKDELRELQAIIEDLGQYWAVVPPEEYERLREDEEARDALFGKLASKRLREWAEEGERRLGPLGVKCYVTGGNDDRADILSALAEGGWASTVWCEGRAVSIDDEHIMVSCGYSNPTPWHTPREVAEDNLARLLDAAVAPVGDFTNAIFNFHPPPHASTLDACPLLDESVEPPRPVVRGGQIVYTDAGSTAVRASIERHQPLLGLHGHIHEARGVMKIGRCTCVNPGSEYGEGILRGILVNLADGKILGYQMTSG
jgi:Icc-related predicted phosphoesterase